MANSEFNKLLIKVDDGSDVVQVDEAGAGYYETLGAALFDGTLLFEI